MKKREVKVRKTLSLDKSFVERAAKISKKTGFSMSAVMQKLLYAGYKTLK